ncbi:protein-disulfide reductase DsbD family protein [Bdellovibrio sp. HCB288]|uniref:protein-disulfide reductase DsbD family protein n=1 Tax=Bdellovibrio sp. HCB288 TaxID=3394355 RepID=UPI0039B3A19B
MQTAVMGFFVFTLTLLISSWAMAAPSSFTFPQGKVELLSSRPSWNTEEDVALGLHFNIKDDWHIYWKNSGDSGAAPKWKWNITNGSIKEELWPVPQRYPLEGMINFGYSKETLYKFLLSAEAPQQINAQVKLEFLICKIECIPYFTDLELNLPHQATTTKESPLFTKFLYPEKVPTGTKWDILSQQSDDLQTQLYLSNDLSANIKTMEVFPLDGENFKTQSPHMEMTDSGYRFTHALQDTSKTDFSGSPFLVSIATTSGDRVAFEIALSPSPSPALAKILFWALLGGLILNIMPCVFPVLSIKVLSFLGPEKSRHQLRISGWFYSAGVIASFIFLGGVLLFLRSSGEQLGWGFQLQSPAIAAGIATLFFWLGFNFLGTFEIGQSLTYLGSRKTKNTHWGSFLTGVLATVVATPCTAPFMGAAIGASLTLPPLHTLAVFAGLGLGMALPFLALAYFPQALRILPKPGAWMEKFKEFLAFPLFATVIWLLWVLAQQIEMTGVLFVLILFLCIGLWIWCSRQIRNERLKQIILAIGFVLSLAALYFLPESSSTKSTTTATPSDSWNTFNETSINSELKSGNAIFIDFTAAWCITCQVNKKLVLNTTDIQNLFSDNKVKLYKADWTDRDPEITKALARFGRNSLPLYVYYSKGSKEPQILPEILTKSLIQNLFTNQEKSP